MLLLSLLLSGVSPAQTTATRIGYVDTQRIIRESELFTVGRERLSGEFSARTQVLELEEARLRELETRRDREIDALTSQETLELRREIEVLERSIQRRRTDMKQAMNRRINELSETIDQRIREEIGAYAREQGFDLVLTDGVGFAHPRLDITDAILQRVNAHAAELRGQ
jgi:outer membrane protein